MFYPVESLKRGGRFYLCWVADSWPLRFATITHRQLWSQDVRRICDHLLEVMNNESGRPANRFSLRLSSQLMRGLVRLYQKKVNVFLSDLCMINANVTKQANKKFHIHEVGEVQRASRPRQHVSEQLPQITLPEEPENEQRIVEIIQSSGNIVSNIQEITLREATIPEFQLPPNDGFGEENLDQALQLLANRTVEQMMQPTDPSHHSGIDAALDITDKSHDLLDKSRLLPTERQMERISEHEKSMFLKPNGEEFITGGDFEKEIQIPEIPDILIPEIPIPPQEQLPLEPEIVEAREEPPRPAPVERPAVQEPEEIELEELEEPEAKRRRFRKLVIDKKTRISANVLRARIDNPNVELRCEDSSEDIIEIRVPCDVYMRRPCHAGANIYSNLSLEITRLFMRNLGVVYRSPRAEREFQQEEMMHRPQRPHTRSMLERIQEVEEPTLERPQAQPASISHPENITHPEISLVQDADITKDILPELDVQKEIDVSEMLTQKIEALPQETRKRKTAEENVLTPKKQRSIGYVAFRESQQNRQTAMETAVPIIIEPEHGDFQMDKENVPQNMQTLPETQEFRPSKEAERSITAMLQEAGLADIQTYQPEEPVTSQPKASRKQGSECSETPLGSLDRTKVSLGDSEQTTDSKRFIRDQWGTEGTMIKILKFIRDGSRPVTVRSLISKGPVISGYKSVIAARCFTSILKLKQHGFVTITKYPDTLEIKDIELGLKFD